jgi:hypothetical protein
VPYSVPYTGERLEWAIEVIGWSKNEFGRQLDMHPASVRQMLGGHRFIPPVLAAWVETLAAIHLALAKPIGWDGKTRPSKDSEDEADP